MATLIITEKASQARDLRAALGARFGQILAAEGHLLRFTLSFRDVEDLLAERGIMVSYETVRRWVNHFGPKIAADLRKRRPTPDQSG
jgi:transposase-like protein